MTEHTFGVKSLAFSPSTEYLATLGDLNDGFLFIWQINPGTGAARLYATNKCTSFVRAMTWMGTCLITVGTRHAKVWRLPHDSLIKPRPPSDSLTPHSPRALNGRNCLLGDLGDSIFTCVASISDQEAVMCTESGIVCILDDTDALQKLNFATNLEFGIHSVAYDVASGTVWFGGRNRTMQKRSIEELRMLISHASSSPEVQSPIIKEPGAKKRPTIICLCILSDAMVTVDSGHSIRVSSLNSPDGTPEDNPGQMTEISMAAHKEAVLGINSLKTPNSRKADFFTWASEGTINFWTLNGRRCSTESIELAQLGNSEDEANELKLLRTTEDMEIFVSGDKYGVINVFTSNPWKRIHEVRAHGSEITDIALYWDPNLCLISTCGRDRMVQVFQYTEMSLELVQTMDDHVAAVGKLLYMNDGERLLSCSADRTVIIRDRMTKEVDGHTVAVFFLSKVITLKTSPISMCPTPDDPNALVLSTVDRHLHRFDIASGRLIHSFRSLDPETNDTVVMGSLNVAGEIPGVSPKVLVGVSTTDKSIRVYDFERDILMAREFGHTEGVSDVLLLENKPDDQAIRQRTLISTGLDGIIMIWDLSIQLQNTDSTVQASIREDESVPAKEQQPTATKPPLRRILSRSELAGFQRPDTCASFPATPVATPTPSSTTTRASSAATANAASSTDSVCNINNTNSLAPSPPRIRRISSRSTLNNSLGFRNSGSHFSASPNLSTPPSLIHPRRSSYMAGRDRSPSPPSPKTVIPRRVSSRRAVGASMGTGVTRILDTDDSAGENVSSSRILASNETGAGVGNDTSENSAPSFDEQHLCRLLQEYRRELSWPYSSPLSSSPMTASSQPMTTTPTSSISDCSSSSSADSVLRRELELTLRALCERPRPPAAIAAARKQPQSRPQSRSQAESQLQSQGESEAQHTPTAINKDARFPESASTPTVTPTASANSSPNTKRTTKLIKPASKRHTNHNGKHVGENRTNGSGSNTGSNCGGGSGGGSGSGSSSSASTSTSIGASAIPVGTFSEGFGVGNRARTGSGTGTGTIPLTRARTGSGSGAGTRASTFGRKVSNSEIGGAHLTRARTGSGSGVGPGTSALTRTPSGARSATVAGTNTTPSTPIGPRVDTGLGIRTGFRSSTTAGIGIGTSRPPISAAAQSKSSTPAAQAKSRIARRIPSTPSLSRRWGGRVFRSNSLSGGGQ